MKNNGICAHCDWAGYMMGEYLIVEEDGSSRQQMLCSLCHHSALERQEQAVIPMAHIERALRATSFDLDFADAMVGIRGALGQFGNGITEQFWSDARFTEEWVNGRRPDKIRLLRRYIFQEWRETVEAAAEEAEEIAAEDQMVSRGRVYQVLEALQTPEVREAVVAVIRQWGEAP